MTDAKVKHEKELIGYSSANGVLFKKPDIQKGELNNDGKITSVDAKWVLQAVSGSRVLV